jgi:hypothetical protein
MKYILLHSNCIEKIQEEINKYLSHGYELHGDTTIFLSNISGDMHYFQPMVEIEYESNED